MEENLQKLEKNRGVKKFRKKPGTILKKPKNIRSRLAGQKQFM